MPVLDPEAKEEEDDEYEEYTHFISVTTKVPLGPQIASTAEHLESVLKNDGIAFTSQMIGINSKTGLPNRLDGDCVCRGNWRKLVNECEPLFGKLYKNHSFPNVVFTFIGLLDDGDDYYYAMRGNDNSLKLLSCVSDIKGHEYEQVGDETYLTLMQVVSSNLPFRRKSAKDVVLVNEKGYIRNFVSETLYVFSSEDLMAVDWEVVLE